MTAARTYARAVAGYDGDFERDLVAAITLAIGDTSLLTDVPLGTGETANALVTVLACTLALSPAATRSPTAIRKTLDELGKRLRRRIAAAEHDAEMKEFLRSVFHGGDVGGHA
jgi:hypothetical protein